MATVQVGFCHNCSHRFANPSQNREGQYACPSCGSYAVEILDRVPMQMFQQPRMDQNQSRAFQELVNGILQSMPDELMNDLQRNNDHPPTTDEAIASFPRKVFDEASEDPCVICQDDIKAGEEVLILPCGHFFHPDCVTPWLKSNNTCPSCRHELPSEQITQADREQNYQIAQQIFRQRLIGILQGDDRYRQKDRGGQNLSLQEQMAQRRSHHNRVREVRGMLGMSRQRPQRRPQYRQQNGYTRLQEQPPPPQRNTQPEPRPQQTVDQEDDTRRYTCFNCNMS